MELHPKIIIIATRATIGTVCMCIVTASCGYFDNLSPGHTIALYSYSSTASLSVISLPILQ